jgi:hypothetical protein
MRREKVKTFFSADPFSGPALGRTDLGQGSACVLVGTETHPSDQETLFQRTIEKYQRSGWSIVRQETGRVFYAGTPDETLEANIWACPPGTPVEESAQGGYTLGAGGVNRGMHVRRRRGIPPVLFPTSPTDYGRPGLFPTSPGGHALEGRQVPVRMGQVPGFPDLHWGVYNGMYVRWPDCDPRWDAQCPYPTTVIVDPPPGLGQVGPVSGFGGPGGGGFGFTGGPGGMVGLVAGTPSPESGPVTGPSIPCGPAGGPTCPPAPTTVLQTIYPVRNLGGGSDVAHGRDLWYHPTAPCPPGYFRSSPGSPCVKEGDLVDYGEGYFQQNPMAF